MPLAALNVKAPLSLATATPPAGAQCDSLPHCCKTGLVQICKTMRPGPVQVWHTCDPELLVQDHQ